ncbi:MAG: 3-oxoacyl-[acyl-carrier-protein] reductase [Flammeovirgaceae bacterium]|nr:3-oxoacyl-[acyl-carrier-protein] reductase [Flammeovirgaceae bacterium]MBR07581.1 3-oxoacyl-[acyl-carrier-protein] reductase [Rickettsiales bacterium]|tara:strand:+ start:49 stop:795 length:747 start_codon:yes stop_codon:yes gene_type:complete
MKLLEGKNALITGASKGIGRAIALKYAEQGANVAFTYLSSVEKGEALVKELEAFGVKAKGYRSDASDFSAATELIKNVVEDFGSLDVLINNAGITRDNLLLRMSEEQWDEIINVNLKSCFNTVKAASRTLMTQKSGSIINMSSIVGVKGNAGQANYAASKAGIIGFSKSIAIELGARGIRCNVVAPGFIETEMTDVLDPKMVQIWRDAIPLKRGGQPEDVANACVYLGSDMSAYVSGQVLQVDGGLLT